MKKKRERKGTIEQQTPGFRVKPYQASLNPAHPVTKYKLQKKNCRQWADIRRQGVLLTFDDPFVAKAALDTVMKRKIRVPKPDPFPFPAQETKKEVTYQSPFDQCP